MMILQRLISRIGQTAQIKHFNCGIALRNVKPVIEGSESSMKSSSHVEILSKAPMFRVTKLDKRILVWMKRYPNVESVPNFVTDECMQAARTRFRIRCCNIMMVLAIIGFYFAAMSGKKAQREGQSVRKMNLEWHEKMNQELSKEETIQKK